MIFIYLQSCNNADDGHEKVFFIQLILITNQKIKILYLIEAKITIRLRNVLKVEIGEIRVIAPLFIEFLFCSPTYVLNHNPM